jgi:esterase/lipase
LLHRFAPQAMPRINFSALQGRVVGYSRTTIASIGAALDVFAQVKAGLASIEAPILIVHSRRDLSVPVANAHYIHAHVSSEQRSLKVLQRGQHLLTLPAYLPLFEDDVYGFLKVLQPRRPERQRSV